MDLVGPCEDGPANHMYYKAFYERLRDEKVLNEGGVLVTQAGDASCAPYSKDGNFRTSIITKTMAAAIGHSLCYKAFIRSFGTSWGLAMIFNEQDGKHPSWWFDRGLLQEQLEMAPID